MTVATRPEPVLRSESLVTFLRAHGIRVPKSPSAALLADIDPLVRIDMARGGVPADTVEALARALGLPKEPLIEGLGLSRPTVDRKVRARATFSVAESERVLGLLQLVGLVTRMMEESGDPERRDFDVGRWLGAWLDAPNPALGGRRPLSLLDTGDGRTLVRQLLLSMQTGTYW